MGNNFPAHILEGDYMVSWLPDSKMKPLSVGETWDGMDSIPMIRLSDGTADLRKERLS